MALQMMGHFFVGANHRISPNLCSLTALAGGSKDPGQPGACKLRIPKKLHRDAAPIFLRMRDHRHDLADDRDGEGWDKFRPARVSDAFH
jgi:hypothetical protein